MAAAGRGLGEQHARALFGLTNVLVMFGGSKDGAFNQEISELVGQTRVSRSNWQTGMAGRTFSGEDIAIIRPEEIRRLPERHALVIAENGKPVVARLSRCIDGRSPAAHMPARSPRRVGRPTHRRPEWGRSGRRGTG